MAIRLSVVIVTWNAEPTIARCLASLLDELQPGDELIVSDNASDDATLSVVAELAPDAKIVQNGGNVGFPAGCDSGAAAASGDLLILLNPDTIVARGWAESIRRPLAENRGWDVWQALVTMDGGTRVNTDGGIVHFTGISWAGHMGEPIENVDTRGREVGFASGACMAIELATWRRLGGMPEHFFLYCEDVDISLRVRLTGGFVGVEPTALVDHEYEFSRSSVKWRMLERNRWATVLRTYPGALLALLAPALVVTDLAILAAALAGGWAGQKLLSIRDVVAALPVLMRERREVMATRRISAYEFARPMTAELSSPYLGAPARLPAVAFALRAYWRAVLFVLRLRP